MANPPVFTACLFMAVWSTPYRFLVPLRGGFSTAKIKVQLSRSKGDVRFWRCPSIEHSDDIGVSFECAFANWRQRVNAPLNAMKPAIVVFLKYLRRARYTGLRFHNGGSRRSVTIED